MNIWLYIYIRIWIRYIFVRNYDFVYMIIDNLTMSWFWYPNQWRLFIGTLMLFIGTLIPSQWGLFIGTLIPKPMGVIHWYSDTQSMGVIHWYFDTQTNAGYSLVLWYPNQWGLFIGILIPKPMWVIHWYSDAQSRGYNVTIVIRLLRIWITFKYLNHFESLKLHMWFWKCLSIWTILSH